MNAKEQLQEMKDYLLSLENDWNLDEEGYNKFFELIEKEQEVDTVLLWKNKNFAINTISGAWCLMDQIINTD